MNIAPSKLYKFGPFSVNAAERLLFDGTDTISLTPKAFDTLLLLIENSGHVLSKEEIMEKVWVDSFVEENNLAQNISILRKALGEGFGGAKFIETVSKRGYRFIAPVEIAGGDGDSSITIEHTRARFVIEEEFDDDENFAGKIGTGYSLLSAGKPETRYVRNGDVNIAYQVIGKGDMDIVFVMGWVSHLEYFWEEPHFAAFLNRLASFSRLILFDKRGTGLSDRVPNNELPTLEQRMEDVHAVMDAVGSARAVLIGVSEGGPMCSLFAATYPERTTALVMIGTYAKRIRDDDYPWAPTNEQREDFFGLIQRDWGKPVGIEERAPSLANDPVFRDWWATYLRMGASPGAAVALTKMNADIDVRNVLPSVRVPTLVIHREGDLCLKVEEGRYVASRIPGCKYIELGGIDHLPFVGEQNEILDRIEEFLTGMIQADEFDRVLATVMSVKISDSPDSEVREYAQTYIRRQLELFKGREIAGNNGGVLATFDGPARAIRCASAIMDAAELFGVKLQTGLHTGECDVQGGIYSGYAVDLAQKIADRSVSGNILVSRTVKDLVAGSGLVFEDFGTDSFATIDGEWRLFAVQK
ncbi:MAG: alpha/beta fold hydrolase [Saprospiraceae bacterium]|nr:alpha/beta fold hydrolase [Pyrinomonadaceae bacterium]